MISLAELKNDKKLLSKIDWDISPQEAFESYQIKAPQSWKHRGLSETHYFQVSVYQDEARVVLVKKTYKDSEEIAEIEVPLELLDGPASPAPPEKQRRMAIILLTLG